MNRRQSPGFTLIELTLAMTFVAVLLISIALLSIQMTNLYSRGVTLKEVSQAGTEASNEMIRTMRQTQIGVAGIRIKSVAGGGTVICTGTYSYVANDPINLDPTAPGYSAANTIKVGVGTSLAPARLAKVNDLSGTLCGTPGLDTNKNYAAADVAELLSNGSRKLVVRSMTLTPNGVPTTGPLAAEFSRGRGLYNVQLTIGTGVESEITANTCLAPSQVNANENFCAIDTFQFVTRVGSSNR